ncbi:hypothetical protein EK21DRAFT_93024 [Setomelanomma holmii]|uniref:Uncharacterized protein n=1 Tax=Setomelanomma holmii TaxID=210430 RepID=A0A9P4H1S0_9PLEO|nr:hypothetical protein EK21DRAFT_93024 [Setomelanomma holmii]
MAVTKMQKTYQYIMTEDECRLFNLLRRLEDDSIDLFALKDDARLKRKLGLRVNARTRVLGSYEVDPALIIQEFAQVGAKALRRSLIEEPPEDISTASIEKPAPNNVIIPEHTVNVDERDSVFGTQSVLEDPSAHENSHPDLSWESVRDDLIPASVNEVIFRVNQNTLDTPEEQLLRDQFPGMSISSVPVKDMPQKTVSSASKLPRGIKSMVIELDHTEISQDPMIEEDIRKQYPWAAFKLNNEAHTTARQVSHITHGDRPDHRDCGPLKHSSDLADFLREPPATQDFEIYDPQVHEDWDTLEPTRKLDIAHARAIQSSYGKVVDGGGCAQCVERGYKCRVYASDVRDKSFTPLGKSCQNCLIRNITCRLTSPP